MIYVLGDNSILAQAQRAKEQTQIAKLKERIDLIQIDWWKDKKLDPSITIDDLWDRLIDADIITGRDDVKGPEKEGDNDKYLLDTTEGYIVEIIVTPDGNVEIGEIVKGDKLPPKVSAITVINKTSNSIEVEVTVSRLEEGKLSYYYKEKSETEYHELSGKQNTKDLTAIFTELEQNQIYNIKVVAQNKKGNGELVINVLVGELQTGVIRQKGETIWNNEKASIELETDNTNLTLKYQVGGVDSEKWLPYSGPIGNLNHGDTVYAVLTDGNNYGDVATVEIRDSGMPSAIISNLTTSANVGANVTATVTHQDNESGPKASECKWVFTTSSGKIGTTATDYTGGFFNSNSQEINWSTTITGTYYLHVLTVDKAGNKTETVSTTSVTISQLATGITVSPTTVSIEKGKTAQLTATVTPDGTKDKTVIWKSSDSSVATVSNTGLVTGMETGTATITVTTADGSDKVATCSVTVTQSLVGPNDKPLVGTITEPDNEKEIDAEDKNGNPITIPPGFVVVPDGGDSIDSKVDYTYNGDDTPAVQDGIVIEDSNGNQFVWIPIGTIKNKPGDSRGSTTEIKLGRYNFGNGYWWVFDGQRKEPGLVQSATDHTQIKLLSETFPSETFFTYKQTSDATLSKFIENATKIGGYYVGRYNGYYNSKEKKYFVQAGKVSQSVGYSSAVSYGSNMYSGNLKIATSLMNSYAFDTMLVFLGKYLPDLSSVADFQYFPKDAYQGLAGSTGDVLLNVYDLFFNSGQWTTEEATNSSNQRFCVRNSGLINGGQLRSIAWSRRPQETTVNCKWRPVLVPVI